MMMRIKGKIIVSVLACAITALMVYLFYDDGGEVIRLPKFYLFSDSSSAAEGESIFFNDTDEIVFIEIDGRETRVDPQASVNLGKISGLHSMFIGIYRQQEKYNVIVSRYDFGAAGNSIRISKKLKAKVTT